MPRIAPFLFVFIVFCTEEAQALIVRDKRSGKSTPDALFACCPLFLLSNKMMNKRSHALYVGLCCLLSMITVAAVAAITKTPFIFPSLGPTAYLLYFAPRAAASSPRASILGHAIALVCGYLALTLSGVIDRPPSQEVAVDMAHITSAALALGLTCFFLVLCGIDHPPAGATTLIVALGLITHPWQLVVMEVAVAVLLLQAILINRLFGYPLPSWRGLPAQVPPA